jgi:pimeloyl-ACP methyl ester carboxylesterase
MRDLASVEAVGGAARKLGAGIGRLFEKVNPDVWRELGYVTMSSYSLLLPRREEVVDRGPDGLVPVVLVHGLGGNRGLWWPLRLFFRINGRRRVYAFGYEDGTIEEHAEDLKRFVESVLGTTGEPQVDVVAHSLGGVIARYAIQRLGLRDTVRTLVTMATPHQGTYAAQYANTTLTRSLRPSSEVIRDLNAEDLTGYPTRFFSIFSDRDVYVVPHEGMTHPEAENVFLPDVSHSQYLVSPQVFRVVASCLRVSTHRRGRSGSQ